MAYLLSANSAVVGVSKASAYLLCIKLTSLRPKLLTVALSKFLISSLRIMSLFGFKSGHFVETASLSGALRVASAQSVLILPDLSAAFHTVIQIFFLSTLSSRHFG